MKKALKATLNFFKKKGVRIWAFTMLGVIVLGFGILSTVMLTDRIVFTELEFTNAQEERITFDFVPGLDWVDTITISNNNENLSGNRQLNNNMAGGILDDVSFEGQARIVTNILDRLNSGRRTNSFTQFFTGGEGRNRTNEGRVSSTHVGQWTFDGEDISDGVWIRIVFLTPRFVVNRDITSQDGVLPWQIELFDPEYERPRDEEDRPISQSLTPTQYNGNTINAIHIPLGNARNRVTEQTWYLSVGSTDISNTTSIGFTFSTFGNYFGLLRYVRNIDDDYLL
jgi:hypothetical protein